MKSKYAEQVRFVRMWSTTELQHKREGSVLSYWRCLHLCVHLYQANQIFISLKSNENKTVFAAEMSLMAFS